MIVEDEGSENVNYWWHTSSHRGKDPGSSTLIGWLLRTREVRT